MKNKKVTPFCVYKVLVSCELDCMAPIHCINLVNIANLLHTSRYYVKKAMKVLAEKGYAQLEHEVIYEEDSVFPYCGYGLTEKGINNFYYRRRKEIDDKIFHECFEINEADE